MHQRANPVSTVLLLACAVALGSQAWSPEAAGQEEIPKVEQKQTGLKMSQHWKETTDTYSLAASEGASWSQGKEHHLELKSGTFVIEANKATNIATPRSHVSLKPRAVVLVKIDEHGDRIFAVLENLKLTAHKHLVALRFGEEAYIADHEPSHDELIGDSQIGLRQLRVHHVGEGRNIAVMEYSLIQLAEREDLLSGILHSGHSHDKGIKQKIVKAAAVLNVVTAKHGHYAGAYR